MPLLTGNDRQQVTLFCLDQEIASDAEVRLIDLFVDHLPLKDFNFKEKGKSHTGRSAFKVESLLKLYLYGYLNKTRSSRDLNKACRLNIEVQWLLRGLKPCHATINSFRKVNERGLTKVFRQLNYFLRGEGLYSEDTVATDGSKFRAQNSKKNNYNEKKIKDHLKHIDKKTSEYLALLDENDASEMSDSTEETRIDIAQKLDELTHRRKKYEALEEEISACHEKGITQISTTDPDARALPKKMNIVEVAYNVVATGESKHKLITNFEVTNEHDTYALSTAARKAKVMLGKESSEKIKVLADKGFDTGYELKKCFGHNIETYVAAKKREDARKEKGFNSAQFVYDEEKDCYHCPMGEQLKSNGKYYDRNKGKLRKSYRVQHYKLPVSVCRACPHGLQCAGASNLKNSKGRYIDRSEYAEYIEENTERVRLNKELYRQRQQIIEHPFGTIKRQWGYDYTLLKTLPKVRGEFAIIFTVYNLRRAITIFGVPELMKRLERAFSGLFLPKTADFKAFSRIIIEQKDIGKVMKMGKKVAEVSLQAA